MVDESTLYDLVRLSFDRSEVQFTALFEAAKRWPLLRAEYAELLDGVQINSPQAEQLKEFHRLSTGRGDRQQALVDPPPKQRVREWMERFEAGNIDGWWQMNRELTLKRDSTHYGSSFEYRIASLPGWEEADTTMRDRILASAMPFLERAEPTVDRWVGTNQIRYSDLAAYRALVLIKEFLPATYKKFGVELWAKWASLVVAIPEGEDTGAKELHDEIAADASAVAPGAMADAVVSLVRSEKLRERDGDQAEASGLPPFRFLGRLGRVLENPHLVMGLLDELSDENSTPKQLAAILEFLLPAKLETVRQRALQLFEAWAGATADRERALSAGVALLECDGVAAWPRLWPVVESDPEFGRELFLRSGHWHHLDTKLYEGLTEQQLAELYIWLSQNFPHADDPDYSDAGAHSMTPRDSVVQLRDGVIRVLVNRGTPQAVTAMHSVVIALPGLQGLPYYLIEAARLMRQRTWAPLTPAEVLRLVDRPDGRLVQSPEQLADILVGALRKYERWLHGEQNPVRSLWDRQSSGRLMRPVEEDALSDHVKDFLQRDLVDQGMVLNREVEIGRVPGAPIGTRTDIRVDAIRRISDDGPFDKITAVIETKGCWNPALLTAMETQLRDDYLTRLGAPVGIYLVGWFDKLKWDDDDSRRAKSPSWSVAEAQRQLNALADALPPGFDIRSIALDCHAP